MLDYVPERSLRLGQAVTLATADEMRDLKTLHDILLAGGVPESEFRNGNVALLRVYCCGGPNERENAPMIYLPPGVTAGLGDVIEYRVGRPASGSAPAVLNTAIRVRQRASAPGACPVDPGRRAHVGSDSVCGLDAGRGLGGAEGAVAGLVSAGAVTTLGKKGRVMLR